MAKHIGKGRPEPHYRPAVAEGEQPAGVAGPGAAADVGDVGAGTRDPAGSGGANAPDVPVRPGGGGMVYDSGEEELPHLHERDVQARGSFEPGPREPREGEEEG